MSNKKQNGVNVLNDAQEQMRMQVVDLELKARYWKAQFDVRFYTLEAEKLQPEYDAYLKQQQKMQEDLQEEMRKKLTMAGLLNEDGTPTERADQTELDNELLTEEDEAEIQEEIKNQEIV